MTIKTFIKKLKTAGFTNTTTQYLLKNGFNKKDINDAIKNNVIKHAHTAKSRKLHPEICGFYKF